MRPEKFWLNSQAYYLQTNTCKDLQDTQRRCRLTIDYEQLYQLYVDIYEVLEVDLPSYYDILRHLRSPEFQFAGNG